MERIGYLQIVPQTFDERVKMYMKCKKIDLAKMLAEREKYDCPQACAECYNPQDIGEMTSCSTYYCGDNDK